MSLIQLTYISRATERFSVRDLDRLIAASAANNTARGITGALYYAAGRFIQVLEGDDASIRQLYETIVRDPRHTDVEAVAMRPIDERWFAEWSMGALSASLASRAAKEAFAHAHSAHAWSEGTLDAILSEFQAAVTGADPA